MLIDFKNLRVSANYPVYPSYRIGDYMEEYFYKFYIENKNKFDETGYTLIPIFWTNVYNTNKNRHLIQYYLNALPTGKYFTVSQHDDAVGERLPANTLSFEAGGNKNGIPIPLICSPLNAVNDNHKDIFCSFVGSNTHPIRNKIKEYYSNDERFKIYIKNWSNAIPQEQVDFFIDVASRSQFSLCPRGYGAQSFRFYEVLQLGSIPVLIYDKEWLPFKDKIDYHKFCVVIHESQIYNLTSILDKITEEDQKNMIKIGKEIYEKYFTLKGMSEQILSVLQDI